MWAALFSSPIPSIKNHTADIMPTWNRPDDWELWPYSDPNASQTFRRVFAWGDLLLGVVFAPFIYGRIFFHRNSPITDLRIRRTIRREYLLAAAVWSIFLTLIYVTNAWHVHSKGTVGPMWLAGFLQTGRKFTEHLGMSSLDPMLGTRTVLPSRWLLRLSSFFNFEIFVHGLHHRHPRAAYDTLKSRMQHYIGSNPNTSFPVYENYLSATRDMLPHLIHNPGCGGNASPPSS